MITLLTEPGQLCFAGNDIIYRLSSNSYLTDSGGLSSMASYYTTTAQIDISYPPSTNIVAGDYLTFAWEGKSITLTCATTPDSSGLQFAPQAVNSLLYSTIVNLLKNNFEFNRDFETWADTSTAGRIKIKARSYGNKDLLITKSSMSYVSISVTNGAEFLQKENYKILVSLYSNPNLFTDDTTTPHDHIVTIEADVDNNGIAEINFSEAINLFLENKFPAKTRATTGDGILSNIKRFYIKYAESYESNTYLMNKSNDFWSVLGGVTKQDAAYIRAIVTYPSLGIAGWFTSTKRYLSWLPLNRTYNDNEKISVLNCDFWGSATPGGTVYYSDGTTESYAGSSKSVPTFQTFTFKVKTVYDYIKSLTPSKKIVSFTFSLLVSDTPVSQVITYHIDYKYRPTQKVFTYINSFGAPEIFVCNGDVTESVEMTSSVYQNYLPSAYTTLDAELTSSDVEQTEKIQIASGYISADHKRALKDFVRSKNKWEIIGTRYISIIAGTKSERIISTKDKVFSFSFEYQYAYNNEFYSKV